MVTVDKQSPKGTLNDGNVIRLVKAQHGLLSRIPLLNRGRVTKDLVSILNGSETEMINAYDSEYLGRGRKIIRCVVNETGDGYVVLEGNNSRIRTVNVMYDRGELFPDYGSAY